MKHSPNGQAFDLEYNPDPYPTTPRRYEKRRPVERWRRLLIDFIKRVDLLTLILESLVLVLVFTAFFSVLLFCAVAGMELH